MNRTLLLEIINEICFDEDEEIEVEKPSKIPSNELISAVNGNLISVLEEYTDALISEIELEDTLIEISEGDNKLKVELVTVEDTDEGIDYNDFLAKIQFTEDFSIFRKALMNADEEKLSELFNKYSPPKKSSDKLSAEQETSFFTFEIPIKPIKKEEDVDYYLKKIDECIELFKKSLNEDNLFTF